MKRRERERAEKQRKKILLYIFESMSINYLRIFGSICENNRLIDGSYNN